MKFGLLCATDREFSTIKENTHGLKEEKLLGRLFYHGEFKGKEVVISKCDVGKVCCAITVSVFKLHFGCDKLIFVGTAGALQKDLKVGDIVVSSGCVQHDFDGRPFLPEPCIVFSMGKKVIEATPALVELSFKAASEYVASDLLTEAAKDAFGITKQKVYKGVIASGDQFICSSEGKAGILSKVPEAMCCEMEGAAIAQACVEVGMEFCVVRVVSDSGDGSAFVDFNKFCDQIAGVICYNIIERLLAEM